MAVYKTFVSDTHSWLWFLSDDQRLGRNAQKIFRSAENGECLILLPTIVVAEAIYIARNRGVLAHMKDIICELGSSVNYTIRPIDHELLTRLSMDDRKMSQHDKIITITSEIDSAPIITKDSVIHEMAMTKVVW